MIAAGIRPTKHQQKPEQPGHRHTGHQPADPSAGPLGTGHDLHEIGEQDQQIGEDERREDVLGKDLERAGVPGIVGQRVQVLGHVGQKDPGIHHEGHDEPDPGVGFLLDVHSEQLVHRGEGDRNTHKEHAREHDGAEEPEKEPPVVLPETEGAARAGQRQERHGQMDGSAQLQIADGFVLGLGTGPGSIEAGEGEQAQPRRQPLQAGGPLPALGQQPERDGRWKPQTRDERQAHPLILANPIDGNDSRRCCDPARDEGEREPACHRRGALDQQGQGCKPHASLGRRRLAAIPLRILRCLHRPKNPDHQTLPRANRAR
jgi:hypothetical protein